MKSEEIYILADKESEVQSTLNNTAIFNYQKGYNKAEETNKKSIEDFRNFLRTEQLTNKWEKYLLESNDECENCDNKDGYSLVWIGDSFCCYKCRKTDEEIKIKRNNKYIQSQNIKKPLLSSLPLVFSIRIDTEEQMRYCKSWAKINSIKLINYNCNVNYFIKDSKNQCWFDDKPGNWYNLPYSEFLDFTDLKKEYNKKFFELALFDLISNHLKSGLKKEELMSELNNVIISWV